MQGTVLENAYEVLRDYAARHWAASVAEINPPDGIYVPRYDVQRCTNILERIYWLEYGVKITIKKEQTIEDARLDRVLLTLWTMELPAEDAAARCGSIPRGWVINDGPIRRHW